MKRFFLAPLLLFLAAPVQAEIDKKTAEFCMKAADFAGCVQTMQGGGVSSSKKQKLLNEIKKLPSRLSNTSLRDYSSRTLSFTDTLALSSPEDVGQVLYENAIKLEKGLDILYEVWRRKTVVDASTFENQRYWSGRMNVETSLSLNRLFGGKTIDARCMPYLFMTSYGDDIFNQVRDLIVLISNQIVKNEGSYLLPQDEYLFKPVAHTKYCSNDPRKPQKSRESLPMACRNGVWDKNHPKCQLPEEKITSPMDMD